jgi:hypothetical protein
MLLHAVDRVLQNYTFRDLLNLLKDIDGLSNCIPAAEA